MRTLKQTTSGGNHVYDIGIGADGDFLFTSADDPREAYGNIVADAIRTLEGELQLDIERGIPYQRTIWETVGRLNVWKIYVRRTILDYPFVRAIENFDISISNGRELDYKITITTDYGTVEVSS